MDNLYIAVSASSFANNAFLCQQLQQCLPDAVIKYTCNSLSKASLSKFLQDQVIAIVGKEIIDQQLLKACSQLKCIVKYGVGIDNIDFKACNNAKVAVLTQEGTNRDAVGEMTVALMLSVLRNVVRSDRDLRRGLWIKNGGTQLSGKTVGIVGCGNIGSRVVELLSAFKCKILVNDICDKSNNINSLNAQQVGFESILQQAQIISLHVPLNESTYHLIDARALNMIQKGCVLINTSRGDVIDQQVVAAAVIEGHLRGVGLDVFALEPFNLKNSNLCHDANVLTPHIAGNSYEAVIAMGNAAIDATINWIHMMDDM